MADTCQFSADIIGHSVRAKYISRIVFNDQVSDLAPLKRHAGLKTLNLAGLPVADLSVLLELKQLEEVTISADMQPAADALGDVPFAVRVE
jgi:hypothetical protein